MEYILQDKFKYGGFMDITHYKNRLYAIQKSSQYSCGRLCVLDEELNLITSFIGIGNARQIAVSDGIAVITARENGIWLFDIEAENPRLLSHYMTIEFATGVTICSNLIFVSCRQYGVEVIDISNPEKPMHVNIIRTGEVQSTCIYDNVLFCGIWGEMKIIAIDISNVTATVFLSEIPLKGRGDGVVVKDNILYAVSGQHGRNIKNYSNSDDPEYGNGNYIQIFDITDIKKYKSIYHDNLGKAYCMQYDMWHPIICEDKIICCDSVLGVFCYDLNLKKRLFNIKLPDIEHNPVTSITTFNRKLYITSSNGIYSFDKMLFDNQFVYNTTKKFSDKKNDFEFANKSTHLKQFIHGDYSIVDVSGFDNYFVFACGSDGIKIVNKQNKNIIFESKKEGFCTNVKVFNNYIYAAFSETGMVIYAFENNEVKEVSVFKAEKAILQLLISKNGHYAAACLESTEVIMLDISDKTNVFECFRRKASQGPLYGDNFATKLKNDGTMMMFWHRDGLVYSNPENGDRSFKNIFYNKKVGFMSFGPENGCDTDGENIFFNLDGGYVILPKKNNVDVDELQIYRCEKNICGKITIYNELLIAIERAMGIITVTNIKDFEKPYTILEIETEASCGKPVVIDDRIYIPARYDGLLELIL